MIRLIPEDGRPAFYDREEAAPYCCTPAWTCLCRDVFGYEVRTFSIEQDFRRIGGFMYAVVRSTIFGTRLVSMPFSDEGALWFKPGAAPRLLKTQKRTRFLFVGGTIGRKGGHARVGAISFPPDRADQAREAAAEIVAELRAANPLA